MKKYFYLLICAAMFGACENDILDVPNMSDEPSKMIAATKPPFYYDGIYEIRDGVEIDLTDTQYSDTRSIQEFYEMASINTNYVYLGSILKAQSINDGRYSPVGYLNAYKPTITVSFSLPVKSKVIAPKLSSFTDAVIEAVGDKNFSGRQSQVFSYKMKEFNYYKEVSMAFGAKVNIGQLFSIDTSVNSDKKRSNTALYIDFSQIYFSASMDIPDDGNVFRNETTRQQYLSQNPVYVNSVNMGRKAVMIVESKESYDVISTAIRAAFNAGIVGSSLTLDATTRKKLQEAEISIYIVGGSGEDAANTVKGFEAFQEFIVKGGVYSKEVYGVPISFSAAYASDNSMFISEIDI